jgi:predicted ATP-dependent protease
VLNTLTLEQLYRPCDPAAIDAEAIGPAAPSLVPGTASIPGQQRAREAMAFALAMPHSGYNLYVMGPAGLGRHQLARQLLTEAASQADPGRLQDWGYVHNFADAQRPLALALPTGQGRELRQGLGRLIEQLSASLIQSGQSGQLGQSSQADDLLDALLQPLAQAFAQQTEVLAHLQRIKTDWADGLAQNQAQQGINPAADLSTRLPRYGFNLLVDNAQTQGCPLIDEDNPSYARLMGRIEHRAQQGGLHTDFSLIRPGALHRANGGYLLLDAERLLASPLAWSALKRVLRSQCLEMESVEAETGLPPIQGLMPQAMPLALKLVLIGDRATYFLLQELDAEFAALFPVVADFAEDQPRDADSERHYARLIAELIQGHRLRPFTVEATCRVIEQSARLAADAERLSLRLDWLRELLQEADYWAGLRALEQVGASEVDSAIGARARRLSQWQERLQEQIQRHVLMIDTKGRQLGRVNALSVLQTGEHVFGTVTRISATARLGNGEIVDIEREVDQGGQIHSKGVLIIGSYLARRYAKNQPLSLAATLAFEQTYGEIEGDSASAAELCALLSAIGDLPLLQSLAITGSINQHGEIQAIGAVNEKIEGFFDLCQARGLSGEQGVIIPAANARDLMLRQDLRQAVAEGQFHLYSAQHLEDAMELLCGLKPGMPDQDGVFSESGFNYRVQLRLLEWISLRRHYASSEG